MRTVVAEGDRVEPPQPGGGADNFALVDEFDENMAGRGECEGGGAMLLRGVVAGKEGVP